MGCFGALKTTPKGDFFFPASSRRTWIWRQAGCIIQTYCGPDRQFIYRSNTLLVLPFNVLSLTEFHLRCSKWLLWLDLLADEDWGKEGRCALANKENADNLHHTLNCFL